MSSSRTCESHQNSSPSNQNKYLEFDITCRCHAPWIFFVWGAMDEFKWREYRDRNCEELECGGQKVMLEAKFWSPLRPRRYSKNRSFSSCSLFFCAPPPCLFWCTNTKNRLSTKSSVVNWSTHGTDSGHKPNHSNQCKVGRSTKIFPSKPQV